MKESITKFDLEAAFKALDELETPKAERGIKSNRAALNEIFSRKTKFDALFEEYYDVSNTEELSDAQNNREAEIAKAKLARIEKIVDLDAQSPDELLASYVGKYIIQCPQCMTLFYKNQEDVEASEEDETNVNVGEACQHCGNESGYTLIGKVGAAEEEAPAAEEPATETADEETTDLSVEEDSAAEAEEPAAENAAEDDFDLDAALPALAGGGDEEEDTAKEESFENRYEGNYLLEQLTEEAEENTEMDISDAEFKELLNSDEFSRTISEKSAQAMLANMDEALKTCEELEEELAAEEETDEEALNEGGLGLLAKTIGKKLGQFGNKVKDKASASIDKFADSAMTPAEKADWILRHTLKPDVKHIQIGKDGKMIPNEKDQKFNNYVVIGFDSCFSDGEEITASPTMDNEDLVISMPAPQFKKTYAEAESIAKGWSMDKNGGPAFILLCKDKDIDNAAYLHQFFKGELDQRQDKMEEYFQEAKQDLAGKEHIAAGGGIKDNAVAAGEEQITADKLAVGDIIAQGSAKATVTKIEPSPFGAGQLKVTLQMENGTTKTPNFKTTQKVKRLGKSSGAAQEAFKAPSGMQTVMENLDELNEDALESLISTSLIEAYKNVAGFRLTGCEYVNEALEVNGKVFFESGCHRELTYKFNNARTAGGKVTFRGLNEKLGADKSFELVGKTDKKTFIAESFKRIN